MNDLPDVIVIGTVKCVESLCEEIFKKFQENLEYIPDEKIRRIMEIFV